MGRTPTGYQDLWKHVCSRMGKLCPDGVEFDCALPASEEEICQIESRMERRIPFALRSFFHQHTSSVALNWYLNWETIQSLPNVLQYVRGGDLFLSIGHQHVWHTNWSDWESRFKCASQYSPSGAVQYQFSELYPFIQSDSGDTLVIVTDGINKDSVVFQSFEDGPLSCARLAVDFDSFLSVWGALGFVGPNEWALIPFYDQDSDSLSLDLSAACEWRRIAELNCV